MAPVEQDTGRQEGGVVQPEGLHLRRRREGVYLSGRGVFLPEEFFCSVNVYRERRAVRGASVSTVRLDRDAGTALNEESSPR